MLFAKGHGKTGSGKLLFEFVGGEPAELLRDQFRVGAVSA